MIWLRRFGYRGLSMRELLPYVRGGRQGKVVGITFDDGYRNVYQNALPVLNEQGFTATNYFAARQLDGGNVWDYEKGIPHSYWFSAQAMWALSASGLEVGSHPSGNQFTPNITIATPGIRSKRHNNKP